MGGSDSIALGKSKWKIETLGVFKGCSLFAYVSIHLSIPPHLTITNMRSIKKYSISDIFAGHFSCYQTLFFL